MSKNAYLKDERLAEVLALIQVLAYDKITNRSESGLAKEFQSKPATHSSWIELAQDHTEFFRVREGNDDEDGKTKNLVSLVSRFVLPKIGTTRNRLPLESNTVNKLMEIAIEIHDRQVERQDRWKLFVPILVALIAIAGKLWIT